MGLFDFLKKAKADEPIDDFTKQVIEESLDFIKLFKERYIGLDFTVESLKKVDAILEDVAEFQEDMEEVQVKTIIQKTSAYIFEVARRNYGGKYYWYEQLAQPILVTGQPDFEISLLALEKVKGRLKNGKEDNIPYFFQGYVDRVKKAKPGDKAMIV